MRPFVEYLARVLPPEHDRARAVIEAITRVARAGALHRAQPNDATYANVKNCERQEVMIEDWIQDCAIMEAAEEAEAEERAMQEVCGSCGEAWPCPEHRAWQERVDK